MKITTGGMELLESTSFIAIGLTETVITVGDQEPLRFLISFVEEANGKVDVNFAAVDNKTLRITLNNWNNPLGTALVEPVEVGSYQDRRLYVLFLIHKAGNKGQNRAVTFSLYLGERV